MSSASTPSACPLSGASGFRRRARTGRELLDAYETHFGLTISPTLAAAYFQHMFEEYECAGSGLRWFAPATAGGSDFYEFLSRSIPWYYGGDTWDKRHALAVLRQLKCRSVFEAGCGSGELLRSARRAGLHATGSEMNVEKIAEAQKDGLQVCSPDEVPAASTTDALVMLQVLEHVPQPLEFVRDLVRRLRPRYLLIAVPGFETLLGYTTDPLVWPPHHISFWSAKSLRTLAELLGAKLTDVSYQPLDWASFTAVARGEPDGRIALLPSVRHRRLLRLCYHLGRWMRQNWALRAHTVFGVLEFPG